MSRIVYIGLCALLLSCGGQQEVAVTTALGDIMTEKGIEAKDLLLVIDKSEYTLEVHAGTEKLKTYSVVFGGNPADDKRMEGDQCTPEGNFGVRDMYPHRKWSKFIWIDYPTKQSWANHKQAKANGTIPQDATIGGEIGIHGVPDGLDYLITQRTNWTWGCISLKNRDVDELYSCIDRQSQIRIVK